MKTVRALFSMTLIVLTLALPAVAAAQDSSDIRVYQPRFMRNSAAMALAYQVCGDHENCHVESMDSNSFIVGGPAAAHAALGALLNERDVPPPTQEFRIIILAADDSGTVPDLPEGARQAVEDIRSVLPYSGFSMIDSGWMRTSRYASTSLGEAGSFSVELNFQGDPSEAGALLIEFQLAHQEIVWRGVVGDAAENQIPRASLQDPVSVLQSQFGINVGETVVVGTSRINGGNQALVVLLTALAR